MSVKWNNKMLVQKYANASTIRKLLYNMKGMTNVEIIVRDGGIATVEQEQTEPVAKPLTVRQQRLRKTAAGSYIGSKKGKLYRKSV